MMTITASVNGKTQQLVRVEFNGTDDELIALLRLVEKHAELWSSKAEEVAP